MEWNGVGGPEAWLRSVSETQQRTNPRGYQAEDSYATRFFLTLLMHFECYEVASPSALAGLP
jgi:hypothetical protein